MPFSAAFFWASNSSSISSFSSSFTVDSEVLLLIAVSSPRVRTVSVSCALSWTTFSPRSFIASMILFPRSSIALVRAVISLLVAGASSPSLGPRPLIASTSLFPRSSIALVRAVLRAVISLLVASAAISLLVTGALSPSLGTAEWYTRGAKREKLSRERRPIRHEAMSRKSTWSDALDAILPAFSVRPQHHNLWQRGAKILQSMLVLFLLEELIVSFAFCDFLTKENYEGFSKVDPKAHQRFLPQKKKRSETKKRTFGFGIPPSIGKLPMDDKSSSVDFVASDIISWLLSFLARVSCCRFPLANKLVSVRLGVRSQSFISFRVSQPMVWNRILIQ